MANDALHERAGEIRLLLLDVDGVLTDGRLYFSSEGDELKAFNIQDGLGLKLLREAGLKTGIITGRRSPLVARRAEELKLDILVQGREDKFNALQDVLAQHSLSLHQVAFMGDDWPDLPVMLRVGLALSVPNGHPLVREHAHWVSAAPGGAGAVREACELLLKAQGHYERLANHYLEV